MAARKVRKDKGSKRELTLLAEKAQRLARQAARLSLDIKAYDQRDRLTQDKQAK